VDGWRSLAQVTLMEEIQMITLQPIMIAADGPEVDGVQKYVVRFEVGGEEKEFVFTHHADDIPGIKWSHEFWEATHGDPFVPKLTQAILDFHAARQT
jgi:hypothetical protein